jgi:hypothetical protein
MVELVRADKRSRLILMLNFKFKELRTKLIEKIYNIFPKNKFFGFTNTFEQLVAILNLYTNTSELRKYISEKDKETIIQIYNQMLDTLSFERRDQIPINDLVNNINFLINIIKRFKR